MNLNAVGCGGMDETEHAALQVNFYDDSHVPDVADVVPRSKEHEVSFS